MGEDKNPSKPKPKKIAKSARKNTVTKTQKVTITHLEMTKPPTRTVMMPSKPRLALMSAPRMPISFYRYLYHEVGRNHHWSDRLGLDDNNLQDILNHPGTKISVLYGNGVPAGFFELDATSVDTVELTYFGLMPQFIGMGLGRWFLCEAVRAAWALKPRRLIVQTNSLDHPRALTNYQLGGFSPTHTSEETVPLLY